MFCELEFEVCVVWCPFILDYDYDENFKLLYNKSIGYLSYLTLDLFFLLPFRLDWDYDGNFKLLYNKSVG